MVSNDILEYGSPGEVRNNYTSGYSVEVNPERQKFDFKKKLSLDLEANMHNGINTSSGY